MILASDEKICMLCYRSVLLQDIGPSSSKGETILTSDKKRFLHVVSPRNVDVGCTRETALSAFLRSPHTGSWLSDVMQ